MYVCVYVVLASRTLVRPSAIYQFIKWTLSSLWVGSRRERLIILMESDETRVALSRWREHINATTPLSPQACFHADKLSLSPLAIVPLVFHFATNSVLPFSALCSHLHFLTVPQICNMQTGHCTLSYTQSLSLSFVLLINVFFHIFI